MKRITRAQAIDAIRAKLLTLTDEGHSICHSATRRGIFCGGFSQFTTGELRKRYDWIVRNRPWVKRAELEDLADRWQTARQCVLETPIACDTQACEREQHHTCGGWNDFDDEQLARFHRELLDEVIEISPEPPARVSTKP